MIPREEWRWGGMAGHWCLGGRCRFHLRTEIGGLLVSTVGEAPDSLDPSKFTTCGASEHVHETMVFRLYGEPCARPECGCGEREMDAIQLEGERWGTRGEANRGHIAYCEKVAREHDTILAAALQARRDVGIED